MTMITSHTLTQFVKLRSKKVPPQWPNPESSIGTCHRYLGRHKCWEAIGEANEVFKTLSNLIKDHLEQCCERPTSPVAWSVYMIGRTEKSANPTIIFSSKETSARKAVKNAIDESDLMKQAPYLAFRTGEANRQPDCDRNLVELALKRPDSLTSIRANMSRECSVGIPLHIFGPKTESNDFKQATIGSLFRLDGKMFASTVAHALPSTDTTSLFEKIDDDEDFEYSLDSEIDSECESDTAFHEEAGVHTLEEELNAIIGGQSAPSDNTARVASLEQSPLSITTDALAYSSDTARDHARPALDFCLLQVDALDVHGPNKVSLGDDVLYPQSFAQLDSAERRILCCTGSAGVMAGHISPTPSFTFSPQGNTTQEHWKVRLDGCLRPGDCGSVVIDAETAAIYGYVVAGVPQSGMAYIVPGYQVFDAIKEHFSPFVELATRLNSATGHGRDTAVQAKPDDTSRVDRRFTWDPWRFERTKPDFSTQTIVWPRAWSDTDFQDGMRNKDTPEKVLKTSETGLPKILAPDSQANDLKCEYPGCTSKRLFKRKYELQRHMKKHAPPICF